MTAPVRSPSAPPARSAGPEALATFARVQLPRIEEALARSLPECAGLPAPLSQALRAAVGVGGVPGSRWRPLLTLATSRALGGDLERALPAAIAIEFTHTASLVLDDLPCMDDAPERRGRASTHACVGRGGAILLGVSLLARSAELLGRIPDEGGVLSAEWGAAFGLAGMAGGQAVDLTGAASRGGAARRLHRKKTTALSALAVRAGARTAHASPGVLEDLTAFGRDLGWAYQLADDAADLDEDGALGRDPGGRAPRRQSRRLLHRALDRLDRVEGLDGDGRRLLAELACRTAGFPSGEEDRRWA
ncbi:MAG: hypothetical protein EA352_07335 [Gemmatimonadales bacterium]|nr:MAG: hypothetical protein EA352_07335 [Gemmatimonadales bacterium]